MSEIQHEDKCRWWDDNGSCDCGALAVDKLETENATLRARIAELTRSNALRPKKPRGSVSNILRIAPPETGCSLVQERRDTSPIAFAPSKMRKLLDR